MTMITISVVGITAALLAVQLKGVKENTGLTWLQRQAALSFFMEL